MKKKLLAAVGILGIVLACLFVSHMGSAAEFPLLAEDVVILTIKDGNQDRIVVYHKATRSFLLYGNSSAKDSGLQLLQIRTLNNDFSLAAKIMDLDYRKTGYNSKDVDELLDKLLRKKKDER